MLIYIYAIEHIIFLHSSLLFTSYSQYMNTLWRTRTTRKLTVEALKCRRRRVSFGFDMSVSLYKLACWLILSLKMARSRTQRLSRTKTLWDSRTVHALHARGIHINPLNIRVICFACSVRTREQTLTHTKQHHNKYKRFYTFTNATRVTSNRRRHGRFKMTTTKTSHTRFGLDFLVTFVLCVCVVIPRSCAVACVWHSVARKLHGTWTWIHVVHRRQGSQNNTVHSIIWMLLDGGAHSWSINAHVFYNSCVVDKSFRMIFVVASQNCLCVTKREPNAPGMKPTSHLCHLCLSILTAPLRKRFVKW